ncbi:hypothetical protein [Candidatus Thiothrix anitrata]|uniref:Uncharacterized protein n=1 Tax=Candidatus Thiothrix anitrata TaxID=2823902 RepID=A0ABX7X4Z7_9GAMM|nr:hypothetical protein [Candidatus Thiothrix anitrata]QTR50945.1 hypothetical protein J8380_05095 [Candidatus Thiothrix anitrata]
MNTSKYATLAKCSNDTALRDIAALLAWGVLVQNPAKGRSTSYRLVTAAELPSQSQLRKRPSSLHGFTLNVSG